MATPFTPGAFVAVVSTNFDRRIDGKRQIHKVFKNGNFTLLYPDGSPSAQQYRPNHDGTTAHRTGERSYREHLEPWTQAIVEEIAERNAKHRRAARRDAIIKALGGADLPYHALHQIETALKFAGLLQDQG